MAKHPEAHELALWVSRDLSAWRNFAVGRHVAGCAACRREAALLADASAAFASEVDLLPGGAAGWDRLAAEMRANVRLGLEAGECVGDPLPSELEEAAAGKPVSWYAGWNPAVWLGRQFELNRLPAIAASAVLVVGSGGVWFWQSGTGLRDYFSNDTVASSASPQAGEVAGASEGGEVVFRTVSDGLVVERGGRSLTLAHTGRAATALTVSLTGSMTAKFVDDDASQVTIHHVYAE